MLGAGHAAAGPARVETQVRRPFNTDRLPLNHSGNSGVRGRPKRGLMQAVLQVTNYGTLPSPTLAQDCSPLFVLFGRGVEWSSESGKWEATIKINSKVRV
jgi:hypothetical protein